MTMKIEYGTVALLLIGGKCLTVSATLSRIVINAN